MKIYGVSILSACFLAGQLAGECLALFLNIDGNVGGVGFAMMLLIALGDWMKKKELLPYETEKGVLYWSAMYIPVVIAMSATQNVKAALKGGWVAVFVGLFVSAACLLLVPLISKIGERKYKKKTTVLTEKEPAEF
jgi:malonate transporter MadL subunit